MSLWVQETYINATEDYIFGESPVYETSFETSGELYRHCLREFGRCASRVYRDDLKTGTRQIGWVFESRQKYEDSPEKYLRSVWITVHTAPNTVTTTPHFATFPK